MNGLFHIDDSLANKISFNHLMLLMACLPFDMFYSHLILVSYAIHTLIHLNKKTIKPIFELRTFALQSVFVVTVFSTIYTINRPEAFNEWGKQITVLIFPLLFCLNPFDIKKYKTQLFMVFAMVCTATIVYLYIDAFKTIKHYQLSWSSIFSSAFTNHNFSEPIGIHATFFSMQLMMALVYLVSVLIKERKFYNKLFYFTCAAILTAGLIQLGSKSILISLLLVMNIAVPWFLQTGRARLKFISASVSFSVLIIAGILSSGVFKERYITGLKLDMAKPTGVQTTDSRLARWNVTLGLIGKRPLTGYGAGSEIGLLQDGFYNNKLYDSYLRKLNTHSEYLSITLKSGIIGLLIYLATLAFGFIVSIRQKDALFFTFMVLIAIISLSENLLDVDKGIFFYAFFFTFFTFSYETAKKNIVPEVKKSEVPSLESEVLT